MDIQATEEIKFPSIVFKVKGERFSINSGHVATIMQLPEHQQLPDAPAVITGVFPYRGDMIAMFDLRTALRMPSLMDEYKQFAQMIDMRKQDHVRWMEELERTAHARETFTLATDPHKCALGMWYDHFHSDVNEVNFHLRKLDEPHQKLHRSAVEVASCTHKCESCERSECLETVLKRVKEECVPKILGLLDETKEIFHSTVYHEMALVLGGESRMAIIVDEVLSVEDLESAGGDEAVHSLPASRFLARLQKSSRTEGLILELDADKIVEAVRAGVV